MSRRLFILIFSLGLMASYIDDSYILEYPEYFPEPTYNFDNNPLTISKIALGRALFYDPILSQDSTISCASCHSPYNAFAHTDHDLSHGINDEIGNRNASALFNLAWHESFMWDGAINHLDMQALAPISHAKEMGEDIKNVVRKLQNKAIYPPLFEAAFNDSIITGAKVLKALSQFQISLVSATSKYDEVKKGEAVFTIQETNGYVLFQKNCNSCHTEPLFTNHQFANNGLSVDTTLNDFGKWTITQHSEDSLLFKIPSLRNLSYSYPYMHDGRFRKLNQVLKHYTSGISPHPTLAPELADSIQLTSNEKVDLIAFLLTLSDKSFIFDKKHQFPREILAPKE
jgi:cytochrome c peroxidase